MYPSFTTADNGKVLGFPLRKHSGDPNDFTGASAVLNIRDQGNLLRTRTMAWNTITIEWEYAVFAGEFPAGRYWAEVAVTFPGPRGPIYSSEVIFDVLPPD
jgi:hypothetical protein